MLGVRVSTRPFEDTIATIVSWARHLGRGNPPRFVSATSVHGVIEAQRDEDFRALLNGADMVAPDGVPLVWVGKLRGVRSMERVYGPALMWEVCRATSGTGVRHFFYGGGPGVAKKLASRLSDHFAPFAVAGSYCPPFRELSEAEVDDVTRRINDSDADILWVGLSTPKQERWVARVLARLKVNVVITVGAAFDYHTGKIRKAPGWLQAIGLEWGYRLLQEPRRLWRRYVYNNPRFLVLALLQLTGLRRFGE